MANLKTTGMALATAAAVLFGSVAVTTAHAEDAKVKCQGGNACKGKGYVLLTKQECDAAKKANAGEHKS